MKFLTAAVVVSFVACLIFTAVCIILNCVGYEVSDTLIQWFFTVFGVEFAASAAIKISKHTIKKQEIKEKVENILSNNLELDKNDLNNNSSSNGFDDYDVYDETMG
ncbi:MAG: hypothetical protein J6T96_05600 [Bacteroidales bacterium]|nr:hypothetical protein [Bacteroidales bacterium]